MMRSRVSVFVFCLLALAFAFIPTSAQAPRAAPLNDNFAQAESIVLNAKVKTIDVQDATSQSGEPTGCGDTPYSVWYKFTAPFDGRVAVSTVGSNLTMPSLGNLPGASTYVGVYTGSSLGTLIEEACDFQEVLSLDVTLGTTYYIRVTSSLTGLSLGAGSYYKLKTSVVGAANYPALVEPSFESNSAAWVVKSPDNGDGRVCGAGEQYDGDCAFKFIGGPEEATELQQKIAWPSAQMIGKRDHALVVAGLINPTAAPATLLKVSAVVSYTDGKPKTKTSMTVTGDLVGYNPFYVSAFLASANVGDVKVVFKNKSIGGSVLVDSLISFYYGSAMRGAGGALPVPLPAQ